MLDLYPRKRRMNGKKTLLLYQNLVRYGWSSPEGSTTGYRKRGVSQVRCFFAIFLLFIKCCLLFATGRSPHASCYGPSTAILLFGIHQILFAAGCSLHASCFGLLAAILPFAIHQMLFAVLTVGCSPNASRCWPSAAFLLFCHLLFAAGCLVSPYTSGCWVFRCPFYQLLSA
ncbi:hypothetical protein BJY52DRAFT_1309221, partial [Lactarius psammicola]